MKILEQAILMEEQGENYYKKQARLNQNNSLYNVCILLANEEQHHAKILKRKLNNLPYELEESEAYKKFKNIFEHKEDFKGTISNIPDQLEFYRFACDNEQKSIDLYNDLLCDAKNEVDKELYEYLISQEKEHFIVIDEIVRLLTNADQWVEAAEFGIREDY